MEQTLGKRIAAHRKALGLTQEQLAEQLGITAQAVSKWENDLSCPDITMLPRLAEIFSISTDALLGCKDPESVHTGEVVSDQPAPQPDGDKNRNVEIRWDGGSRGSLRTAVGVVFVGVLAFLSKWYGWDVSFWEILWPSMLLFYGLGGLFRNPSAFRLGLALFGGYWLGANLQIWHLVIAEELVFPICVVLFGLGMLLDTLKKPKKPKVAVRHHGSNSEKTVWTCDSAGEQLDCSLSFGSKYHRPALACLSGGQIDLSFGSLTVDLSDCQQVRQPCCLEVSCSFGEVVLRLPGHMRIAHTEDATFGTVQFSGQPDPDAAMNIELEADVAFGKIHVEYI